MKRFLALTLALVAITMATWGCTTSTAKDNEGLNSDLNDMATERLAVGEMVFETDKEYKVKENLVGENSIEIIMAANDNGIAEIIVEANPEVGLMDDKDDWNKNAIEDYMSFTENDDIKETTVDVDGIKATEVSYSAIHLDVPEKIETVKLLAFHTDTTGYFIRFTDNTGLRTAEFMNAYENLVKSIKIN